MDFQNPHSPQLGRKQCWLHALLLGLERREAVPDLLGQRGTFGVQGMSEEMQAMCFMAGANSIFYGDKLLVTGNPEEDGDQLLMAKLDLEPETEENRKPLERN